MQETRTAGIAAKHLRGRWLRCDDAAWARPASSDCSATATVPTVMLRADMDALPDPGSTGLDYASTVTATDAEGKSVPVAHACGHDMHVAWLIGRDYIVLAGGATPGAAR